MFSRFGIFVLIAAINCFLLFIGLSNSEWRTSRTAAVKTWISDWRHQASGAHTYAPTTNEDSEPLLHDEETLNTTHPKTTLVLATTSDTSNAWVSSELDDLLGPQSNLYTAFYVADDPSSTFHVPANKGHEAMAYLTYLIDFYTNLPPISIFMHGHPTAWHNNYLLSMSSSQMIRHLNRTKVLETGYFNLRCHWEPGCPTHLDPQETVYDSKKPEEILIKDAWAQLFPFDPIPETLAQPCCSQFAVTREAIHRHPREIYSKFRDFILYSRYTDYVTGRFFEYFWQYIFTGAPTYCPDPRVCYCEGYGVCFEDPSKYGEFFDLVAEYDALVKEEDAWKEWNARNAYKQGRVEERKGGEEHARVLLAQGGPDAVAEGHAVREEWLRRRIEHIEGEMERRKRVAFEAGRDPERKVRAIEAAWREPPKPPKSNGLSEWT